MLCFDIESNGLLDTLTKIHVLVAKDTETGERMTRIGHQEIGSFLRNTLMTAPEFCGHNIIGFDVPALQKVFPWFKPVGKAVDTLVLSRVIHTNLMESDCELRDIGKLPGRLIGGHSLEAWGYRLGEYKGDYHGGWEVCTPEMVEYCEQDVEVTALLYAKLQKAGLPESCSSLEHQVQHVIQRQIRHGVLFDTKAAESLYVDLLSRRDELTRTLKKTFGSWYEQDGSKLFIPKSNSKAYGYTEGCPITKVKLVEFNPGSRAHIAKRLTRLYGWKPKALTETGLPIVDEKVLAALKYPHVDLLLEYLMLSKRIGQVSEGENGWLKLVAPDGRIHGNVNSNGAVTGRMTHSSPNLAQVPASSSPFGKECRSLFTVPKGKALVGCDASGLELRMLAHFMARYDGGKYAKVVVDGDVHWENTQAMCAIAKGTIRNKDEESAEGKRHKQLRDNAKTFIYALLYGAGDSKIGSIIGKGADAGKRLKEEFFKNIPALAALKEAVEAAVSKGYILGLDKRKLHIRSPHAALNTLLQSAGALVMKKALLILDERLQKGGMVPGEHYEFVLNVHDEFQIEVDDDKAELVANLAVQSIVDAGKFFSMRCPLDGEAAIGRNWADTH